MKGINHIKMEQQQSDGAFVISVNSPGNFIAKEITFTGPVNIGGNIEQGGFTDVQIKTALEAIVGKDKVLNRQWKWSGVYWYLRWACNYPVDIREFCVKIESLKLNIDDKYKCEYENMRKYCTLSFIEFNPMKMDSVKYSKNDATVFSECRAVALKLAEELGKSYLPKP